VDLRSSEDLPRNLDEATRRLDEIVATGWPVLMALSNKDFVGEALDLPLEERLTGTLATTAVSAWNSQPTPVVESVEAWRAA